MTQTKISKISAKFRDMAARLHFEIAAKRVSRRENTPKQCKEATARRIDADHLERVKIALELLAAAHDRAEIHPLLAGITSKAQLLGMLRTRVDCSGGYYSLRDTGEYHDQSAAAVVLREFIGKCQRAGTMYDEIMAGQKQRRIEEMERDVKFRPIPGFFPTPPAVVAEMMELAGIKQGHSVLEPSAGKGDLAVAARAAGGAVECVEINHTLADILEAKGFVVERADFLSLPVPGAGTLVEAGRERWIDERFDRIVMNPPFDRGADIEHVRHAYQFLKPAGRLVSVMSAGPFFRSDRKSVEFREWFASLGERQELPPDSFKDSFRSTGISACLMIIDKPSS